VSNGAAYALVVDTGARTEIGKINQGVQEAKQETTKTPLAQKLDEFGNQLTYIIGIICLAVWGFSYPEFSNPVHGSFFKGALYYAKVAVALGVRYHGVNTKNDSVKPHIALHTLPPSPRSAWPWPACLRALVLTKCLGVWARCQVAAIPEGLPAVITLCLSLGTYNAIVRPGIELVPQASIACTRTFRVWSQAGSLGCSYALCLQALAAWRSGT
jgi:hypothetical protein